MIDTLLIYPKLGSMDSMVVDLPLSVVYAAADSVKRGYNVKVVDLRVEEGDWRTKLSEYLEGGVLLAGISVMTGSPLKNSREISLYIRENFPDTRIVWGGPHVTVLPDTITEPYIDFLIRGYGSEPLAELIACLKTGTEDFSAVKGLSYKRGERITHNDRSPEFEMLNYNDIPYHTIDVMSGRYVRQYNGKRAFPIFTSIGCPYKCAFCVHPTIYREINGAKWRAYEDEEIIAHIKYIIETFKASHIVFIDDTSFPNIKRMRNIFQLIIDNGIEATFEFRGARINEIMKMDDSFLELLIKAGGRVIMVGVESGSNRVLKSFQKGITREQTLEANRKLARYPQLTAYYNFIYGTPGEMYEDVLETKDMVLQLIKDNPNAYIGMGGDWKPIPGTKTLEVAERDFSYSPPKTIDEWIEVDSSDSDHKIVHPWYTRKHNNAIKLMQISSVVIDNKIIRESAGNNSVLFKTLRMMSRIYRPIALARLKLNFNQFLLEYSLWRWMVKKMAASNSC